jgi:hypothetical protein
MPKGFASYNSRRPHDGRPSALPAVPLNPATRLGTYDIVGLLGAGGMGEVYRARDSRLHAPISGNPWDEFDVSGDGRFLLPVPGQQRSREPLTVIVNWPQLGVGAGSSRPAP